jgi:hypothetical protein
MESAQPVSSADEVGVVDEGSAQPGEWALPAAGSVVECPKCMAAEGGLHVRYHDRQTPYDPSASYSPQVNGNPCMFLGWEMFPPSGRLGVGGEHLCITCTRCGYGWATKVMSEDSLYWHESEPE